MGVQNILAGWNNLALHLHSVTGLGRAVSADCHKCPVQKENLALYDSVHNSATLSCRPVGAFDHLCTAWHAHGWDNEIAPLWLMGTCPNVSQRQRVNELEAMLR